MCGVRHQRHRSCIARPKRASRLERKRRPSAAQHESGKSCHRPDRQNGIAEGSSSFAAESKSEKLHRRNLAWLLRCPNDEKGEFSLYSSRRLRIGSTFAARRAGARAAIIETANKSSATDTKTERSNGATFTNRPATNLVVKMEAITPSATPSAARTAARLSTSRRISERDAPKAIRRL